MVFRGQAAEWISGVPTSPSGPCEVRALPLTSGGFELRLAYPKPAGKSAALRTLVFQTATHFVVDHWFDSKGAAAQASGRGGGAAASKGKTGTTKKPSASQPQVPFLNAFVEQTSWESILGAEARPLDLNSPELDRFRGFDREMNLGAAALPVGKRPLQLPLLRLLPVDRPIVFSETSYPIPEFRPASASPSRGQQAAIDGMNFVAKLVREKKWLKAREAIEVLLKSPFGNEVPAQDPRWISLRGYVYAKLADELMAAKPEETVKEPDGRVISKRDVGRTVQNQALLIWSDGLRRVTGLGGGHQEHVEYMAVESVRRLFESDLYYGAASLLNWLLRYSWSDRIDERFQFLYAEAFLKLGMFDEAKELLGKYFEERRVVPVSARVDRRLVPAAAFRLGDLEYRRGAFEPALKAYGFAFAETLGPAKFNFEGSWYPDEIRHFPEVFLNRANVALRLGLFRNALNDLRAFLFVAPNDPDAGLAYYLIGDVLDRLGVESEKAEGAWRECGFKVPDSLGARLCQARLAARQLPQQARNRWPRLIGLIEDALPSHLKTPPRVLEPADLEMYVNLAIALAFIEARDPGQALIRLASVEKLEASAYLREWHREHLITAFVGVQGLRLADGKGREAIAEYEKRRLGLFLGDDRPAVLLQIARAFADAGLWSQAQASYLSAEKTRRKFRDAASRPFDSSESEWRFLKARIWVGALEKNAAHRLEAQKAIQALDQKSPETQRLWLRFARLARDESLEMKTWSELSKMEGLTWAEVEEYERLLAKRKSHIERRRLLESRVGTWFGERERSGSAAAPPRSLIVKLAEARSDAPDASASLTVWDHLLSEPVDNEEKAFLGYRKGLVLNRLARSDEARQSFESARNLAPESLWGRLSAAALAGQPSK